VTLTTSWRDRRSEYLAEKGYTLPLRVSLAGRPLDPQRHAPKKPRLKYFRIGDRIMHVRHGAGEMIGRNGQGTLLVRFGTRTFVATQELRVGMVRRRGETK
jgi:hypothetical protein